MRPFIQGQLDALCGVYAVLNSLKALGFKDRFYCWQATLESILVQLNEDKQSPLFMTHGIKTSDISRILKNILCAKYDIQYSKPFHRRANVSINELWETLSIYLSSGDQRTAIIFIRGLNYGHWTVVSSLSAKRLTFLDSGLMDWLNRSRCTTTKPIAKSHVFIHPPSLFLLERKPLPQE